MTDPRDEKIAELERQLAEAAAQLARVRADLSDVKGTSQRDAPQGRADVADRIREALQSVGFTGELPGIPAHPSGPVARLAEPPRRVPPVFWLTAFSWRWWEAFGLIMVVTAPAAVWIFLPEAIPAAFIVTILVITLWRVRGFGRRRSLLRWGKVATVTSSELVTRGTYFSGTTYNNQRVAQAVGWEVNRRWYSGPASTTRISYQLDGVAGELVLRGLPYVGGVVLADSRQPSRALCVSSYPFTVHPDASGEWVVDTGPALWIGGIATLAMYAALLAGAVASVLALW